MMPRARSLAVFALLVLWASVLSGQTAAKPSPKTMAGAPMPTWTQIEAQVRHWWADTYPKETVRKVEKIGEPAFNAEPGKTETMTSSSSEFDWSDWSFHDTSWSTTIKGREGSYLRQMVNVTVERPNKTQAKFHVAALYKLTGKAWQFAELPVGQVEELAAAGSPAQPSDADMAKIFTAGWSNARPDFKVLGVKIAGKEFHQSQGRFWLTCKIAVTVEGSAKSSAKYKGKRFVCKPADYNSVLKWDPAKSAWAPDESMIQNINEDAWCEAE
jgi:hypothetical protein